MDNNEKEILLEGLKMAIDTNRWKIQECKITIIPTSLAIRLYNLLSDNEKLILEE